MSAAEKRHMGRIAAMPCCLCGDRPVHVHHIREGEAAGAGQKAKDFLTIPLCPDCHTGPLGVHGDKTVIYAAGKNEHDLLAETLERLYGGIR